jgi:hypothetical protein
MAYIIGTRNRLIHNCSNASLDGIWDISRNTLPELSRGPSPARSTRQRRFLMLRGKAALRDATRRVTPPATPAPQPG